MTEIWSSLPSWLQGLAVAVGAIAFGLLLHLVFWTLVKRLATRTVSRLDDAVLKHARKPTLLIFPTLAVHLLAPLLRPLLPHSLYAPFESGVSVVLILGVAWLLLALGAVFEEALLRSFRVDVDDNLEAREIHTQVRVIRRVFAVVVVVLALAAIMMSFERVRELGAGLLASAGLAGLVLGLASQRALANILAGIQIAFTQPVRIDDVVVVEGEWGRVEEITLTYVVVRIWDQRRLVLPISYFIEKAFQNWTRTTADILGTVYLYADYDVPLDAVRAELKRIVEQSEDWDGKVQGVVVTGAREHCIEIRALVSSSDSSKNWNLRCEVREALLSFLQQRHPASLPRFRAQLHGHSPGAAATTPASATHL